VIFILVVPFLMAGCSAFIVCAAIPPLQRFALGASLWFVACVPCIVGLLLVMALCDIGAHAVGELFRWDPGMLTRFSGRGLSWPGWLGLTAAALAVGAGASIITVAHGIVIRRMTLSLFKLYVAFVSFGVGVLSSGFLAIAIGDKIDMSEHVLPTWTVCLLLAVALSRICYRNARLFRGTYPKTFPIVTREEFGHGV
jgi:hypothetical protein